MALNLLPLGTLGAIENNGVVSFGLWLPWVSAGDGNVVSVKIIHEADQFLQHIAPREVPLTHSVRAPYGDCWSATIPIAGTPPETAGVCPRVFSKFGRRASGYFERLLGEA